MSTTRQASRRGFLAQGGAATVVLATLAGGLPGTTASAPATTIKAAEHGCLRDYCHADFTVGQHFRAGPPGQSALLRLVQVTPAAQAAVPAKSVARAEPFSLLFLGVEGMALSSEIHEFQSVEMGQFKAFVSQVGGDATLKIRHYEVIFG